MLIYIKERYCCTEQGNYGVRFKEEAVEHRWSERSPVTLDAILSYSAGGLVRGKTRDASQSGVAVETGAITLRANTSVELTVTTRKHGIARLYHFRVLVVWATTGMAGLMFRSFDEVTHSAIIEFILDAENSSKRETTVLQIPERKVA